jgi:hypothetical protein
MTVVRTASPERINAVTSNFFFWQGLRWVPMGFALLVAAWSKSTITLVPEGWQSLVVIVTMAVAMALSAAAGQWYGRSFGRVHGIPGQHARRTRTKWLVVYPMLLVALAIDGVAKPPFLISGFAFAIAIEAYRRSTGGGRRHYVIASVLFGLLTFAPVLRVTTPGPYAIDLLFALLGATYVIGGVLDHLELKRVLPDVTDGGASPSDAMAGMGSPR